LKVSADGASSKFNQQPPNRNHFLVVRHVWHAIAQPAAPFCAVAYVIGHGKQRFNRVHSEGTLRVEAFGFGHTDRLDRTADTLLTLGFNQHFAQGLRGLE